MEVALYARVSTGRQAEKDLSIPDQLRQMREWCKKLGHNVAVEFVEPGASATNDRRPVLQEMVAMATLSPAPFEAIIIHSLSRFFRDSIDLAIYERRLIKAGVRLISITQQTSDDPSGEMARRMFSLFDEYQSKENAKHTLRAMKENARQGYFNGSTPPFGYRLLVTESPGRRGHKKRLEIDLPEATVVKQIFDLYTHGISGAAMGTKTIAVFLNERGIIRRGAKWSKGRIADVLSDQTYAGKYYFNKRDSKTRKQKPESEWICIDVEPIVDAQAFSLTARRRQLRHPAHSPAGRTGSKSLLTGLLRCGSCGAGMTLATGKGGRYRYYKCTNRINKGNQECSSANAPMEKLDRAVLDALADRVFTFERVAVMLRELARRMKRSCADEQAKTAQLRRDLSNLDKQQQRLFDAVEQGFLPLDDTLKQRSHRLQARRQALLVEKAGLARRQEFPLSKLRPGMVDLPLIRRTPF